MRDPFDFRRRQDLEGAYWFGFVTGLVVLTAIFTLLGG